MKKLITFLLVVSALHAEFRTHDLGDQIIQYNEKATEMAIMQSTNTDLGVMYVLAVAHQRYMFTPNGELDVKIVVGKEITEVKGYVFDSGDGIAINVDRKLEEMLRAGDEFVLKTKDFTGENFNFRFDTKGLDFNALTSGGKK